MKLTQKLLILVAVVLILIGGVTYFIIIPTVKDINMINNAVITERKDLEIKYQRGQLLKKTLEDFEKIEPQKEILEKIFITQGEELEFITTLENIATSDKLIQEIRIQKSPDNLKVNNATPLALEISITGDYFNALKYIHTLESLPYYFNIANISIQGGGKNQNAISPITLTFSGTTFTKQTQTK